MDICADQTLNVGRLVQCGGGGSGLALGQTQLQEHVNSGGLRVDKQGRGHLSELRLGHEGVRAARNRGRVQRHRLVNDRRLLFTHFLQLHIGVDELLVYAVTSVGDGNSENEQQGADERGTLPHADGQLQHGKRIFVNVAGCRQGCAALAPLHPRYHGQLKRAAPKMGVHLPAQLEKRDQQLMGQQINGAPRDGSASLVRWVRVGADGAVSEEGKKSAVDKKKEQSE
jgi:hypothetical protein